MGNFPKKFPKFNTEKETKSRDNQPYKDELISSILTNQTNKQRIIKRPLNRNILEEMILFPFQNMAIQIPYYPNWRLKQYLHRRQPRHPLHDVHLHGHHLQHHANQHEHQELSPAFDPNDGGPRLRPSSTSYPISLLDRGYQQSLQQYQTSSKCSNVTTNPWTDINIYTETQTQNPILYHKYPNPNLIYPSHKPMCEPTNLHTSHKSHHIHS